MRYCILFSLQFSCMLDNSKQTTFSPRFPMCDCATGMAKYCIPEIFHSNLLLAERYFRRPDTLQLPENWRRNYNALKLISYVGGNACANIHLQPNITFATPNDFVFSLGSFIFLGFSSIMAIIKVAIDRFITNIYQRTRGVQYRATIVSCKV